MTTNEETTIADLARQIRSARVGKKRHELRQMKREEDLARTRARVRMQRAERTGDHQDAAAAIAFDLLVKAIDLANSKAELCLERPNS